MLVRRQFRLRTLNSSLIRFAGAWSAFSGCALPTLEFCRSSKPHPSYCTQHGKTDAPLSIYLPWMLTPGYVWIHPHRLIQVFKLPSPTRWTEYLKENANGERTLRSLRTSTCRNPIPLSLQTALLQFHGSFPFLIPSLRSLVCYSLRWWYFRLKIRAVSKMRAKRVIIHKQMGQSSIEQRFFYTI